ncbi:MAG: diguanylate cyclase [Rhodospirillales bacterium]|nr:diguanylate cyclase [Rhodospirillales bacterium]
MADSSALQRILIVDDEPLNIQVLNGVLDGMADVFFAINGETALDIAIKQAPDLILLDVMMPAMDGYEVCRQLKSNPITHKIPVIFVTALSQETDETLAFEVGAIDYITKPISPPVVRARVKNHLELKRYRDQLEHVGTTDGLTKIANRHSFDMAIEKEWARAKRSGTAIGVIIADIDFFKAFNDNYGHLEGDECLKNVAQALSQVPRRPADLLARFGGEEFICLLPETDTKGISEVAETLRNKIHELSIPHEHSEVAGTVTMSFGLAVANPAEETTDIKEFLNSADKHLYAAKAGGRDQIQPAPPAFPISKTG